MIKISKLWFVFIPLGIYTHTLKIFVMILWIMLLHECGHLICALLFHFKIENVTIYPFGVSARIYGMGYGVIWKENLVLLSGLITHLFQPILFYLLFQTDVISYNFYIYCMQINFSILLFNLYPVYPLDGGRILLNTIHLFVTYEKGLKITYGLSFIHLMLLHYFHLIHGLSSYIITAFLVLILIKESFLILQNKISFYYYRLLFPYPYKIKIHNKYDFYRNKTNVFYKNNGWLSEEQWLSHAFGKIRYKNTQKTGLFML